MRFSAEIATEPTARVIMTAAAVSAIATVSVSACFALTLAKEKDSALEPTPMAMTILGVSITAIAAILTIATTKLKTA